ncbi:MAG: hypothetical protein Q8M09_12435 [Pseudomonadota bacterium]|nr:hypothetical protein [Pseudomonadota bacterium]MDP1905034.1 hypothetical protein [Pseudomonadota bacterium]MDP2354276.1 hypothetical protein [Pseudomonadota bacterium]
MANTSWKAGDKVFYRPIGHMQPLTCIITHIWPEQNRALLDTGDVIELRDDLLTPPPDAPRMAADTEHTPILDPLALWGIQGMSRDQMLRLIGAAPALLNALELVVRNHDDAGVVGQRAIDLARAAIAEVIA